MLIGFTTIITAQVNGYKTGIGLRGGFTSGLAFVYGFGARVGFYNGKYYQERNSNFYYADRNYSVISLVGILGLEYKFKGAPITLGFDILPYIDLSYRSNNYIDGSIALRYTF
jgi:hypothetical protein